MNPSSDIAHGIPSWVKNMSGDTGIIPPDRFLPHPPVPDQLPPAVYQSGTADPPVARKPPSHGPVIPQKGYVPVGNRTTAPDPISETQASQYPKTGDMTPPLGQATTGVTGSSQTGVSSKTYGNNEIQILNWKTKKLKSFQNILDNKKMNFKQAGITSAENVGQAGLCAVAHELIEKFYDGNRVRLERAILSGASELVSDSLVDLLAPYVSDKLVDYKNISGPAISAGVFVAVDEYAYRVSGGSMTSKAIKQAVSSAVARYSVQPVREALAKF